VERTGERRRRYYTLTAPGRTVLKAHRSTWEGFVNAIRVITALERA
jgi:DNA-binding PadR family transcriptional regulator